MKNFDNLGFLLNQMEMSTIILIIYGKQIGRPNLRNAMGLGELRVYCFKNHIHVKIY